MADIKISKSGEFMVAHIEGETERGDEFIDAYNEPQILAIDYGRIILPVDSTRRFTDAAQSTGLIVSVEEIT